MQTAEVDEMVVEHHAGIEAGMVYVQRKGCWKEAAIGKLGVCARDLFEIAACPVE
jgi:hypothetical protein